MWHVDIQVGCPLVKYHTQPQINLINGSGQLKDSITFVTGFEKSLLLYNYVQKLNSILLHKMIATLKNYPAQCLYCTFPTWGEVDLSII